MIYNNIAALAFLVGCGGSATKPEPPRPPAVSAELSPAHRGVNEP